MEIGISDLIIISSEAVNKFTIMMAWWSPDGKDDKWGGCLGGGGAFLLV